MWLHYVSNGMNIQHVLNGGEKELSINNKTYKVDGFCEQCTNSMDAFGMVAQIVANQIS